MPENSKEPVQDVDAKPAAGPSNDELRTQLEVERSERQKLEKSLAGIRSLQDRRDQDYRRALSELTRRSNSATDSTDYALESASSSAPAADADLKPWLAALEERQGLTQFKLDNPDWRDYWEDLESVWKDPQRAAQIGAYVPGTERVDIYRTLQNAKTQVEVIRLRKAQEEAKTVRESARSDQAAMKAKATISGVGASAEEEALDIGDLDAKKMRELAAKGIIEIDPANPPSFMRDPRSAKG